ncbi:MAG: DUF2142 domain-containing protein [Rhizobiaceae bacterium]
MRQYLEWPAMCNMQWLLPFIFVVLALPSTLLSAYLTPPFQVPDEIEHYFYARSISLGHLFPSQLKSGGAGGVATTTDQHLVRIFQGIPFKPQVKVMEEMLVSAARLPDGPEVIQNYWGSAIYPPSAYMIPAAALFALSHLDLNPLHVFFGGRIANSIAYVVIGALAIWLTPVGKFAFCLILLLPMSLSQAGSFSADAQVFSLAAIICALIAREAGRELPAVPNLVLAALLLVLLATTKAPLIALVVPLAVVSWRRSRLLATTLTAVVLFLFVLWVDKFVLTEAQALRTSRLGNVSPSQQLSFLLSSPLSIVSIAFRTISSLWWRYTQGMIGIFGWQDTTMSKWFYYLAIFCIAAIAAITTTERSSRSNMAFLASAVLATALTFGALYLSWSKVGSDIVSGVQGRYFIPIMFPAALALPGIAKRSGQWSAAGLVPILVLWVTSAAYVPLVLVERFYLH